MNNQDEKTPSAEQQAMVDALAAALFQAAQQQAKTQEAVCAQGDGRTIDLANCSASWQANFFGLCWPR